MNAAQGRCKKADIMPIMAEKKQLRAIVAKRLSHMTDATTHLVTETETIDEYVKRKNIKVWAEAEDLDVSGGKPIGERPKVGKLLSLEFLDEWDVLILYKLDRGFRNHLDFVTFYHEFCERYGKQIVSVGEEGLDMSTNMGRMFAGVLVQFAEWELHTISERRTKAMSVMRREARYPGGPYPFGYEPYQDGPYWYLRPHPVYAKEVEQMALALVSGKATVSIASDLNARGIPTVKAQQAKPGKTYTWTAETVRHILSGDQIRGYVMHSPDWRKVPPVRVVGADGEFVRRGPLIDDELWFKVQEVLTANARPKSGIRFGASLLLRVGFCGYCGGTLHRVNRNFPGGLGSKFPEGKEYRYYFCQNRRSELKGSQQKCDKLGSVPQEALDDAVSAKLVEVIGGYELTEKRLIEGDDHTATLKRIGMQIADLTTQHYVNNGVPDFHTRMAELEAEHARVSALPREKPKVRRIATGKTFRQRWEEMDDEQRHAYLKSTGVHALVVRNGDFTVSMVSEQGTQAAEDMVLDIPMNVITEVGDKWVVSIGLGTLREQLQHVEAI
jgi:site-specific DNA recombinase